MSRYEYLNAPRHKQETQSTSPSGIFTTILVVALVCGLYFWNQRQSPTPVDPNVTGKQVLVINDGESSYPSLRSAKVQ